MTLPLKQPYLPMEAKSVAKLPIGDNWQYEPKWDGFRCIAFRDGDRVDLQSKSGQPLGRYFPEVVEALLKLKPRQFVLDGEIVVPVKGKFSFDDLLMRIHPAASRIKKLSQETPAKLIVFDLLVDDRGKALVEEVCVFVQFCWEKKRLPLPFINFPDGSRFTAIPLRNS